MLAEFQNILRSNFEPLRSQKLLVAVSGGCDSMVLCELLRRSGCHMVLAHGNFGLRGADSDADEAFVKSYGHTHDIPVFSMRFDTLEFAKDHKLSVQQAARELRYAWFFELMQTHHLDVLLTAHHADDNLETLLINVLRGTGTAGLLGIPEQTDKIARPLLHFTRARIQDFATQEHIAWREDQSNTSHDYLRNQIRHEVLPALRNLRPEVSLNLRQTQQYLRQTMDLADDASRMVFKQAVEMHEDHWRIDVAKLAAVSNPNAYLYHWLQRFGFTAWDDVYGLLSAQTGKTVLSADHRLVRDRGALLLLKRQQGDSDEVFKIRHGESVNFPINLQFIAVSGPRAVSNNSIFVDADLMEYPLELRHPKAGDLIFPAGMDGQSKKVGKFLRDAKCSPDQKSRTWLLCSGANIIWIVGYRADERFTPTAKTTNILQIVYTP